MSRRGRWQERLPESPAAIRRTPRRHWTDQKGPADYARERAGRAARATEMAAAREPASVVVVGPGRRVSGRAAALLLAMALLGGA